MSIRTNTPHVDPAWAEAFLLELRLGGVSGRRIGAALAEVEAHCAESGETAYDAFGDPVRYADALRLPGSDDQALSLREELGTSGLGLAGMLVTLAAVGALRAGTAVDVTAATVVSAMILVAATLLVVTALRPLVRALARHGWVAAVLAVVPVAVFVGVQVLLRDVVLFILPAGPCLLVGVLALAVSTILAVRRSATLDDPVVGPAGAEGAGTLQTSPTTDRVGRRLTPWLFPILTVVTSLPLLVL